ncbi:General secretory system II protein E domain protein [Chthoniobacter flavus Ellin428]|uniref:General secretory system II protein E domain protein n=1 Tax=Chthoniobacter flavus Ellin428 TaxID=497964 RepID=B4CVB4_9BACT|nr:general secretion pathway protein GspE [Chthoniobacter flavus]EDY21356.1 General secretory system II protein E domain protein [Chthoniobacter flavus Ellin428]TCO95320.1 type II secretion system (T2SS) protein E [Chthoniobacter flavus]
MLSTASPPTLSSEEQEQILQTIEMFEVITQANPQDCQSMDILKDAYQRVGKQKEALQVARRLADTYVELGQFSAAMLEYEGILQKEPDNGEVIVALGDVEEKLQKSGQLKPPAAMAMPSAQATPSVLQPPPGLAGGLPSGTIPPPSGINLDFRTVSSDGGTLMTTAATMRPEGGHSMRLAGGHGEQLNINMADDGNEALAKFLIQHRLVTEEVVSSALERVQKKNKDLAPNVAATSLVDEISRRGAIEQEALLASIVDRSKFAYIPLEYYDVDRSVVKMLPESLSIGRLIVPFDIISRTVMIAMANPFDSLGKEAVQQLLDYNVQWHLASPQAILKALGDTYRIEK